MGTMWHVKNWFRVGHDISWSLDIHTLGGYLFLSHPNRFFYNQAQKKHEFIMAYLAKEMESTIERFRSFPELEADATVVPEYIWTLWWQGEENAPPLVKACISSMRRNAGNARLVVITKDNCKDFMEIPEYILEKHQKGWISFAQLSDIIRFLLLEKHGGLWLDSTVYVSSPIPDMIFSMPFFSQHTRPEKMTCWVQNNRYHGFIIASLPHAKLASFAKAMFLDYWRDHDTLVDYLMIDYIIMTAYREYDDIRREIDSLPWSSERLYDLVHLLDDAYDEKAFGKLEEECLFSKLDWHRKYRLETGGKETYYSKLISRT